MLTYDMVGRRGVTGTSTYERYVRVESKAVVVEVVVAAAVVVVVVIVVVLVVSASNSRRL